MRSWSTTTFIAVIMMWGWTGFALGEEESLKAVPQGAVLSGIPLSVTVTVPESLVTENTLAEFLVDGQILATPELNAGTNALVLESVRLVSGNHNFEVRLGGQSSQFTARALPGWLSLMPPILAIGLALLFRDVIFSLALGIFGGALCLTDFNPFQAAARSLDHYVVNSVADESQASLLIFTLLLGGMVGLITKNGGTRGIVNWVSKKATDARHGQLATWLMGVLIFFDDYANTLVVGTTMRPITDRLKISREKLAYIVDSTAAPVASLAPISTWVGYELGLIVAALGTAGIAGSYDGFGTFLHSIPYRFYPIFALVLGFTLASTRRDFGPMLKAELRTADTGSVMDDDAIPLADFDNKKLEPPQGIKARASYAFLPILAVVVFACLGLWKTGISAAGDLETLGYGKWLIEILENANSFQALLWGSLAGVVTALVFAIAQPGLTVRDSMLALVEGLKSMLLAVLVLVLAWSLGSICNDMHTADFLKTATSGILSPQWIPVLTFLLSAAIAFATGTSWATMAILFPISVPLLHRLAIDSGMVPGTETYSVLLYGTVSSVLAGSVWGDHCSPISDTTILSSLASGCDHIAHVRTQIPYAVGAAMVGIFFGDIPTAFGLSPWISLLVGSAVIVGVVFWKGQKVEAVTEAESA